MNQAPRVIDLRTRQPVEGREQPEPTLRQRIAFNRIRRLRAKARPEPTPPQAA